MTKCGQRVSGARASQPTGKRELEVNPGRSAASSEWTQAPTAAYDGRSRPANHLQAETKRPSGRDSDFLFSLSLSAFPAQETDGVGPTERLCRHWLCRPREAWRVSYQPANASQAGRRDSGSLCLVFEQLFKRDSPQFAV